LKTHFQTNNLDDFLFPCKWGLSEREAGLIFQVTLGPPRQGRGPNTHDNFDYFAVTGWNLPLVELENELENN